MNRKQRRGGGRTTPSKQAVYAWLRLQSQWLAENHPDVWDQWQEYAGSVVDEV